MDWSTMTTWDRLFTEAILAACRPGRNHRHLTVVRRAAGALTTEHGPAEWSLITEADLAARLRWLVSEGILWETGRGCVSLPTDVQRRERHASDEPRTCAICGDSIPAGQGTYHEVEATMRASSIDATCWLCRRCA